MINETNIEAELRYNAAQQAQGLWIFLFQDYLNRISGQFTSTDIDKAAELADQALAKFKNTSV